MANGPTQAEILLAILEELRKVRALLERWGT